MNNKAISYMAGFLSKCAEYGVDGRRFIKMAGLISADASSFTLPDGKTIGHVKNEWNTEHPGFPITVQDIIDANDGLPASRYVANRSYRLPAMNLSDGASQPPVAATKTQAVAGTVSTPPETSEATRGHLPIIDWAYRAHPGSQLLYDVLRTNVNRAARKVGIPYDKSIWPGGTVTTLGNDQMDWLRLAIMAKGGGKVATSGNWGGKRHALGKTTDEYRKFVHPGFPYAGFPTTDTSKEDTRWYKPWTWGIADKVRSADWRTTGVPNQIEHLLGDFSWTTDEDGNIIVNDTYDFNVGEGGRNAETSYGGIRQWAGRNASTSQEPDSQKTKYRINLGNPSTWGEFDEARFRSFNEPYRKKFPDQYLYNPTIKKYGEAPGTPPYYHGFLSKCSEYGVDGKVLLKTAGPSLRDRAAAGVPGASAKLRAQGASQRTLPRRVAGEASVKGLIFSRFYGINN